MSDKARRELGKGTRSKTAGRQEDCVFAYEGGGGGGGEGEKKQYRCSCCRCRGLPSTHTHTHAESQAAYLSLAARRAWRLCGFRCVAGHAVRCAVTAPRPHEFAPRRERGGEGGLRCCPRRPFPNTRATFTSVFTSVKRCFRCICVTSSTPCCTAGTAGRRAGLLKDKHVVVQAVPPTRAHGRPHAALSHDYRKGKLEARLAARTEPPAPVQPPAHWHAPARVSLCPPM